MMILNNYTILLNCCSPAFAANGNRLVLACSIAFHNCFDQILRNILVIGQKLFCILWEAVSTITKGRIIIVRTDTRIKAHTVDDVLRVQAFNLCIGIQLVEVGDTEGKIRISKQLNSFCFGEIHEQGVDVWFLRTFLEQPRKRLCLLSALFIATNDDTGRIQIVVKGF